MSHPENTLKEIIQMQDKRITDSEDVILALASSYANLILILVKQGLLSKIDANKLLDEVNIYKNNKKE